MFILLLNLAILITNVLALANDTTNVAATVLKNNTQVPEAVSAASSFITEFHKTFQRDPYYIVAVPFLTSVSHYYESPDLAFLDPNGEAYRALTADVAEINMPKINITGNMSVLKTKKAPRHKPPLNCNQYNYTGSPRVEVLNDTEFYRVMTPRVEANETMNICTVVMFYAAQCPFSAMAAPHMNALPRAFPNIRALAIDAYKYDSMNPQFGIIDLPMLVLFYNGRPVARFNESEYTLSQFSKFLTRHTGIKANENMFVFSYDFGGPLRSVPSNPTNYFLMLCYGVIIFWALLRMMYPSI